MRHEKPIPRLREEKPCPLETISTDCDLLRDRSPIVVIARVDLRRDATPQYLEHVGFVLRLDCRRSNSWLTLFVVVESLARFFLQRSSCCCIVSGFFHAFKGCFGFGRLLPIIHIANEPASVLTAFGFFGAIIKVRTQI